MALAAYKQKRDLKATPEPGGGKSAKNELIFVVQRHKASHLHYDFRLECNGVLKSWAVPKGPSMNPEDKRLAMMVEDHPYDYKDFSGVIPKGNYGAGLIEIWDSGTYSDLEKNNKKTAEKKISEGIEKGNLKFRLNGKKLKGEFALVKVKDSKNGENAWLLLKHKDEFAVDKAYDSEQLTAKNSPINKWLNQNQDKAPAKKKSRRLTHSKFFMMIMAS